MQSIAKSSSLQNEQPHEKSQIQAQDFNIPGKDENLSIDEQLDLLAEIIAFRLLKELSKRQNE